MSYPPQPGQPYPPAPPVGGWPAPPAAAPKRRRWPHIVGYTGTALLALLIGIGAGGGGKATASGNSATPAATVTVATTVTAAAVPPVVHTTAPPPTPTKPPAPPKPTISDGKGVVGDDFPAGTYDVRGAPSSCYWEITKHASSDIVDNSFGTGGHLTVVLKVGEDFETEGCGTWTKK